MIVPVGVLILAMDGVMVVVGQAVKRDVVIIVNKVVLRVAIRLVKAQVRRLLVMIAIIPAKEIVVLLVKAIVTLDVIVGALQNVLQIAKTHAEGIVMEDCLFRGNLF